MHLFTWNVCGRLAMAPHALKYLERIAKTDHVIATLQEWPWEFPDLSGYGLQLVPTLGKALLLYSSDLQLLPGHSLDASERATIARFRLPAGNELTAVGLHWHSRDSRSGIGDPYERGGAMALFRHYLDDRMEKGTPAVVMGDFNCSGHEREMSSQYCLFARAARHRSTPAMEMMMGREKRAWVLVEPAMPEHVRTFFWSQPQEWSDLDHVVLTAELAGKLAGAEVLIRMEGHDFLTDTKQVPRSPSLASDHLPVVCRIHYQ